MTEKNKQLDFWLEHDPATTTTFRNEDGTPRREPLRDNQHHDGPRAQQMYVSRGLLKDKGVKSVVKDD